MSARLDEGTLARFWGSLNQPVRPAVQAWTAIPIIPEKLEEFKRVQTRQLEYKSITDPRVTRPGPRAIRSSPRASSISAEGTARARSNRFRPRYAWSRSDHR